MISDIQKDANSLGLNANQRVILFFNGCRNIIEKDLPTSMGADDKKLGTIAFAFACGLGGKTLQDNEK